MNNRPFTVGQRVRCVKPGSHGHVIKEGQEYVIQGYVANSTNVTLEGVNGCWMTRRFVPANVLSPLELELDLAAYIAKEKKELGL